MQLCIQECEDLLTLLLCVKTAEAAAPSPSEMMVTDTGPLANEVLACMQKLLPCKLATQHLLNHREHVQELLV